VPRGRHIGKTVSDPQHGVRYISLFVEVHYADDTDFLFCRQISQRGEKSAHIGCHRGVGFADADIRQRGKNSFELKFDAGRDPATGKRNIQYASFKGTKREAQVKLAALITSVGAGSYVEPSKSTVAEFVRARVTQWEAAGDISARTAQRYRQLVENQIAPHIGAKLLQKLTRLDIEAWHNALQGGLAARTIGHAHRVRR
jgi:hypothetical protein